jgi:hypothetical protein
LQYFGALDRGPLDRGRFPGQHALGAGAFIRSNWINWLCGRLNRPVKKYTCAEQIYVWSFGKSSEARVTTSESGRDGGAISDCLG